MIFNALHYNVINPFIYRCKSIYIARFQKLSVINFLSTGKMRYTCVALIYIIIVQQFISIYKMLKIYKIYNCLKSLNDIIKSVTGAIRPSRIIINWELQLCQKSVLNRPRELVLSYFLLFFGIIYCIILSILSNIFFCIFCMFIICVKNLGYYLYYIRWYPRFLTQM